MKPATILLSATAAILAAATLGLLATNTSHATASSTNPHPPEPWSFKEGRGISLGDATRKALNLNLESVEFSKFAPERRGITAQVYRPASAGRADAAASLWLPSKEAAALVPGQKLELTLGDSIFGASVSAVGVAPRAGSPAEILLAIQDPASHLRTGDFLRVNVKPGHPGETDVAVVPSTAVVESVRGDFVYVANGQSFLRTPVVIGARSADRLEIVDGLFEGDEIVTTGASSLWMIELQAVNGGKGCADGH